MSICRSLTLALLTAGAFCALPASAKQLCAPDIGDLTVTLNYSNTGCFTTDDNEQSFIFTLSSFQTVKMFTTSWITGGFAPTLTLFDDGADNNFLMMNAGGQAPDLCGARGIGGGDGTQTCLDAYMTAGLGVGTYRLVLTESGNPDISVFNDETFDTDYRPYVACVGLQDNPSFTQCGNGNFTGQTGFRSPNNFNQLTHNWAVSIQTQTDGPSTPEPVSVLLGLSGLLATWLVRRRTAK